MAYKASAYYNDLTYIKEDRDVGLATNLLVVPKCCHELFKPLDISWPLAKSLLKREFIIDEFCMSRNLAKYKYSFAGVIYPGVENALFKHLNFTTDNLSRELALKQAASFMNNP
jgi:hypothetical protein